MFQAGAGRLLMLPIAGIAILITTRIAIDVVGGRGYGVVALLVALPALIPISDLGLGGTVTSHIGRNGWIPGVSGAHVRRVVGYLTWISIGLTALAGVLAANGVAARLLGISTAQANLLTFVVVALFGITLPLGVGSRILIGFERQALATVTQALIPVYGLALLAVELVFGLLTMASVVITLAAVPPLAGAVQCLLARRLVHRYRPAPRLATDAADREPAPTSRFWLAREAVPLAIISIAIPIAYQSDRVVLAHLSTPDVLAQYSIISTLFGSLAGVIASAGNSLWPFFLRVRANGGDLRAQFVKRGGALVVVGVVMAAGLVALGSFTTGILTDHKIHPSFALICWFAALLVTLSIQYPLAMLLICFDDLWYQAGWCVVMLCGNLAASIALAHRLGATGPVLASVVTTLAMLVLPLGLQTRRRFAREPRRTLAADVTGIAGAAQQGGPTR